jgi:hypothetical protein
LRDPSRFVDTTSALLLGSGRVPAVAVHWQLCLLVLCIHERMAGGQHGFGTLHGRTTV